MSFAELKDHVHVAAVNRAQEVVGDAAYNHAKVKEWVQQITDTVVADCRALSLEFKWIGGNWRGKLQVPTTPDMSHVPSPSVSVAIMQQTGAGMSAYTSAVGSGADGAVTATYETPAVVVLVSIYAAAGSA